MLNVANMLVAFGLQLAIAKLFGAGRQTDTFFLATSLPAMIATVLVGSLNVSLIPSFSEISVREGSSAAWIVMSKLCTLLFLVVGGITIVVLLAAPVVVKVLAPRYSTSDVAITTTLLQLSAPSIFFLALAGVMTSLLFAQRNFVLGGVSVVVNNILILGLTVFFAPSYGIGVVSVGLSLGAAVQFLIVYAGLRNDIRFVGAEAFRDRRVWGILSMVTPLLIGSLFYKSDILVGRVLAGMLPQGELSWLSYAQRMATFLVMLTAAGVSTVIFPRLAGHGARGDKHSMGTDTAMAFGYIAMLAGGVLTVVVVLAPDLVRILLQRGAFGLQDTLATGSALVAYSGMVYAGALAGVYSNTLYSMKRVKAVVTIGLAGFGVYVVLAVCLIQVVGFLGVALAASISSIFNLALYMTVVSWVGVHVPIKHIAVAQVKLVVAAVIAGAFGFVCRRYSGGGVFAISLDGLAILVMFLGAAAGAGSLEARAVIARIFAGGGFR